MTGGGLDGLYDDLIDDVPVDEGITSQELGIEPDLTDDTPADEYQATDFYKPDLDQHDDSDEQGDGDGDDGDDGDDTPLDLIGTILLQKGITDRSKIQYENDEGEIEELDFETLSLDEQIALLTFEPEINQEDELYYAQAQWLKEKDLTLEELVAESQRAAVEEYIQNSAVSNFSLEGVEDDELFKLDLKANYEDLTDEEVELQLQLQKEHPELFRKKITKLRQDYIDAEKEMREQEVIAEQERQEEDYINLANELIDVAKGIDDIGGLDLSEDDKVEILDFILERDSKGVTNFVKSIEDPKLLFNMAWFAIKGQEGFDILHKYYIKEIETSRATAARKTSNKKTVVRTTTARKTQNNKDKVSTIEDLYG